MLRYEHDNYDHSCAQNPTLEDLLYQSTIKSSEQNQTQLNSDHREYQTIRYPVQLDLGPESRRKSLSRLDHGLLATDRNQTTPVRSRWAEANIGLTPRRLSYRDRPGV